MAEDAIAGSATVPTRVLQAALAVTSLSGEAQGELRGAWAARAALPQPLAQALLAKLDEHSLPLHVAAAAPLGALLPSQAPLWSANAAVALLPREGGGQAQARDGGPESVLSRVVTAANDGAVVERCVAQFIDEPALWALQALRVSLAVLPWDPLTAGSLLAHSIHMLELAARGDAASVWPGVDTALRGAFVADPSLQGLIALASGSGAPAEIARLNVNFTMHDSPRSRDRRQGSAQRLGPCREWMRDGKCRFEKTEDGCKYPHPPRNHQWRREAPRQRASKPAQGSAGPAPAQTQAAQGGPAPDQAKASG